MHRQAVLLEQKKMQEENFILRVGNLPVVSSAWTQACDIYQKTKERNALLRTTCNMAEGSVKTLAATAKPLVVKCQPQIDQVNAYACHQLARMEEHYPVITQPTDLVIKESKEKCESLLKPVTDRVTTVKDTYTGVVSKSKDTMEAAKNIVPNTVSAVKDYSMTQVNRSLETPYGKFVMDKVQDALTLSEEYVEKYLPESDSDDNSGDDDSDNGDEVAMEKMADPGTVSRVTSLSSKVRHRMYKRAMKDIHGLQVRSKETLSKLTFTVDLIHYAKTSIGETRDVLEEKYVTAQEKFADVWHEITDEEGEEEEDEEDIPQNFEKRTIIAARKLTRQVRQSMTAITGYLPANLQPGVVRERLEHARQYSEELYNSFKEARKFEDLPSWLLTQTKEKMGYLQETVTFLTDTFLVTPVSWLMPVRKPVGPLPEEEQEDAPPTDMEMEQMTKQTPPTDMDMN